MDSDWIELLESLVAHKVDFLLLNWLSGLTYDDAASDAPEGDLGGFPVRFLSRRAFVANKTAAARPKDLLDAQILSAEEP